MIKEDGTVLCESDRIVTFMNPTDDCIFSSYLNTDFLPSTKSAIISSSLLPSITANLLKLLLRGGVWKFGHSGPPLHPEDRRGIRDTRGGEKGCMRLQSI